MMIDQLQESVKVLREAFQERATIGLVLGSGLGPLAEQMEDTKVLSYGVVPYMASSTAPDHKGRFVFGKLGGKNVLCMQGRLHGYEGYSPDQIAYPIRLLRQFGVDKLILTNASGGINTDFAVGDLMILDDHINLTGKSSLTGGNYAALGTRFPDMTFVYSAEMRRLADQCANKLGMHLRHGIYMGVNGPQFETPAEIRAYRNLGADAVGMSTVLEAIAAVHCGMELVGISMITNMAAGVLMKPLSGAEVNEIAEQRGADFRRLVTEIIGSITE